MPCRSSRSARDYLREHAALVSGAQRSRPRHLPGRRARSRAGDRPRVPALRIDRPAEIVRYARLLVVAYTSTRANGPASMRRRMSTVLFTDRETCQWPVDYWGRTISAKRVQRNPANRTHSTRRAGTRLRSDVACNCGRQSRNQCERTRVVGWVSQRGTEGDGGDGGSYAELTPPSLLLPLLPLIPAPTGLVAGCLVRNLLHADATKPHSAGCAVQRL